MIDIENVVYNRVATAFSNSYPNGSSYGEATETPAKFPCLTLTEQDNSTYTGSLDAEMKEHDAWVMYDLNVYSNKVSGAKQECKAIMALADSEMLSMGFTRMYCNPTKNFDSRIYRMTARYRAVVSEHYRIYRE